MLWHSGRLIALCIASAALVSACGGSQSSPDLEAASLDAPEVKAALEGIHGAQIEQHMRVLADDALEGRGPGTAGYEGALRHVETTVKSYGLAPAGEAGGFRQRVPLRNSVVVEDASSMAVRSAAGKKTLAYGKDYLLGADPPARPRSVSTMHRSRSSATVSALPGSVTTTTGLARTSRARSVAYLSGAPAKLPSNERAYYSSGAAKEAEAARRGAIGTISFTSPDDPRFRWDVSVATGKQGGYAWVDAQGNPNRGDPALRGSASLNHSGVAALFAGAPKTPAEVFAAAAKSTPQAFDLADPRVARHTLDPQGRRERQPRRAPRRAATRR